MGSSESDPFAATPARVPMASGSRKPSETNTTNAKKSGSSTSPSAFGSPQGSVEHRRTPSNPFEKKSQCAGTIYSSGGSFSSPPTPSPQGSLVHPSTQNSGHNTVAIKNSDSATKSSTKPMGTWPRISKTNEKTEVNRSTCDSYSCFSSSPFSSTARVRPRTRLMQPPSTHEISIATENISSISCPRSPNTFHKQVTKKQDQTPSDKSHSRHQSNPFVCETLVSPPKTPTPSKHPDAPSNFSCASSKYLLSKSSSSRTATPNNPFKEASDLYVNNIQVIFDLFCFCYSYAYPQIKYFCFHVQFSNVLSL